MDKREYLIKTETASISSFAENMRDISWGDSPALASLHNAYMSNDAEMLGNILIGKINQLTELRVDEIMEEDYERSETGE